MYDKFIYGKDDEERIVGVHLVWPDRVRVYTRLDEHTVISRDEPLHSYAYFDAEGHYHIGERFSQQIKYRKLKGDMPYKYLYVFDDWKQHWEVVNEIYKDEELEHGVGRYYMSATQQYLTGTGKTMFKGMTQQTIKRMQVDIEVTSEYGRFPSSDNPFDEIIMIQLSDNFGMEKALVLDCPKLSYDHNFAVQRYSSEADLLRAFVSEVIKQDPDVLELHNGLAFDLPYIKDRADMHGITLGIGRDSTEPRTYTSQKKLAERDIEYTNFQIAGRSVIDTMFLTGAYDVFTRSLDGWGLKPTAEHFRQNDGITYEEQHGHKRQYIEGDMISRVWETDPDTLLRYAMDDVRETRYISDKLAGATFYLTQMMPLTYQEVHLSGTGRQIESIMARHYLHKRHSLPKPEIGRQQVGGYTEIFLTGRFRNIVYADVASLYPSIMLGYHCHPERDVLGAHRKMLQSLTDLRLKVKAEANAEKDPKIRAEKKAREQSFKIVINSAYGVMGDRYFLFNDFSEADRVTTTGQELLKELMRHLENEGATIIECDTDGVLCHVTDEWTEDEKNALVERVSDMMPEGIKVDNDGLYDVMLSVKKKNYALKDYNGKIKVKGGAFKSRGIEPFLKAYIDEQLKNLFDGNVEAIRECHDKTRNAIMNGDYGVRDLMRKTNLKESLDTYEDKVREGGNRRAQYEIAKRKQRRGENVAKGDTIYYYIAGDKKLTRTKGFLDARPIGLYKGDENKLYYVKRLSSMTKRFKVFFDENEFKAVFNNKPTDPKQTSLF